MNAFYTHPLTVDDRERLIREVNDLAVRAGFFAHEYPMYTIGYLVNLRDWIKRLLDERATEAQAMDTGRVFNKPIILGEYLSKK